MEQTVQSKEVENDKGSSRTEGSRSGEVYNFNGSRRCGATMSTWSVGSIEAIAGQHARCGIIHERDLGNIDIRIIERGSSKLEHVGQGGIGIAAVKASEAPIQFYSAQGRVMSVERVIGGVSEFSGNNATNEARPYFITLPIITIFVKGDKNERILHECCIGKGRLKESVEPGASETTVGVVTVVSDVGGVK